MPSVALEFRMDDFAHSDFRVRVERHRGVVLDESMVYPNVAWTGYGARPRLDLVLRGTVRVIENGVVQWLKPGDFTIGRALDSLYLRMQGDEILTLAVEWNLGTLSSSAPIGLPSGSLDVSDIAHLTAAAEQLLDARALDPALALDRGAEGPTAGIIASILSRLRSVGVPFDRFRARDLVSAVSAASQRTASAIGRALSRINEKPSLPGIAAELGLSPRRVADVIAELTTRYGFNGHDWRAMRDRWRLTMSAVALSHPLARTEDVARAVGYGSSNALCQAFRIANLPSPGQVRARLAILE
jgi:AraC-like DNA-binding protein